MTLQNFLGTLKSNTNILVTITDSDENEVCRIYAGGTSALDDALEAREVARWSITSASGISVSVKDAVTP